MTLKEQIAADLDMFFNTDEFGVTVTYDNGTDDPVDVTALVDYDQEGRFHADYALIYVKESDVANPAYRDKFTIAGQVWRVVRDIENGAGAALIAGVWSVKIVTDERFTGWGG